MSEMTVELASLASLLSRQVLLRELPKHALDVTAMDVAFFGELVGNSLVLRHFAGQQSRSLFDLEVPLGSGLGGAVALRRSLMIAPDYFAEPKITHDYDARVRAEGVQSLVAVPVLEGNMLAGVLYVGARHATDFGRRVQRDVMRLAGAASEALNVSERVRDTVDTAIAEDRRHVAIELHDSVGQMLFSIGATAHRLCEETQGSPDLYANFVGLEHQIREAAATLRQAISALGRPPADIALEVGLVEDVRAFEERSGIRAQFLPLSEIPSLTETKVHALRAVCREALLNIEKHAECADALVTLYSVNDGVGVTVMDNGSGYNDESDEPVGLGVTSCTDRLERLGGWLTITPNEDGAGTSLRGWVPC